MIEFISCLEKRSQVILEIKELRENAGKIFYCDAQGERVRPSLEYLIDILKLHLCVKT